jgi:small ligand-binding sensory domain FIST
VEFQATEEAGVFTGWPEEGNRFLLVCDPFTFPADLLLRELDRRQPGVTVTGGMASGGVETAESQLFLGDRVVSSGGVGARLLQRSRSARSCPRGVARWDPATR